MNVFAADAEQDPHVIAAFTSAAITALQELTQLEAGVENVPTLEALIALNAIAATVQLVRDRPGSMTLLVSEESASRLASRYLPKGTALTEELVNDVVGEMANVIAGQAKTILKGTPYHFLLSTPNVARVPFLSPLAGVLNASQIASVVFGAERLILIIQ